MSSTRLVVLLMLLAAPAHPDQLLLSAALGTTWPVIEPTEQSVLLPWLEAKRGAEYWDGQYFHPPVAGDYLVEAQVRIQHIATPAATVWLVVVVRLPDGGYRYEAESGLGIEPSHHPEFAGTVKVGKIMTLAPGEELFIGIAASARAVLAHPEHVSWLQIVVLGR